MPYPQTRDLAPDFALRSSSGREYRISDLRGRRNLVLLFAGSAVDSTKLAQAFSHRAEELESEEASFFVILRGDMVAAEALRKRDRLSCVVLADADGSVHERYGSNGLYLTDRYGEIYSIHRDRLPSTEELLASLRHINAECPE